jgi:hypothetical protein
MVIGVWQSYLCTVDPPVETPQLPVAEVIEGEFKGRT